MPTRTHVTTESLQPFSDTWNSTYVTVCSLSSSWEETADIVPVVTNYLSSNSVTLCSISVSEVVVLSSLVVLGTATFVQSETLITNEPIIYLAEANAADLLDIGLAGSWVGSIGKEFGGLVRRADNKYWVLFSGITADPLSGVNLNWNQNTLKLESLSANFLGDIYGNRNVFGNLQITNGLTVIGNISGNNLTTSFNQGSATGVYSYAQNTGRSFGNYSHAEGLDSVARGNTSHAEGLSSQAIGDSSHAEGQTTTTVGSGSHAEGGFTTAIGNYSHAEGLSGTASEIGSHAEGITTVASGSASHAEGFFTRAIGSYSHAEGENTEASGNNGSHAEGSGTIASGAHSHAEGEGTIASGGYSHAEGDSTLAEGPGSHAEGTQTRALAADSHAEGNQTIAGAAYTHAEGQLTRATRIGSHAGGFRATTAHNYSYAWSGNSTLTENVSTTRTGQYMISAPGGVFIPGSVGIGTDSIANALTVAGTINTTNHGNSIQWNGTFTTVRNISADWSSSYSTLCALSGQWNASSTLVQNSATNWNSTYSVVRELSSSWNKETTDLPTVVNYLSTNSVTLCTANVRGQLLSAGVDLFNIFVTNVGTDGQTLTYVPSSYNLSISNGNTVNLSSINTVVIANSANWQSTYLTVSALSASWEESAEILPTVINYLSTNNVLISSLQVTRNLTMSGNILATNISATGGFFGQAQDNILSMSSTNTVQNSTIAFAISSINANLLLVSPAPTYNLPIATLTDFPTTTLELGTIVSQGMVLDFTQNDAGAATLFEIFRNNSLLQSQALPFTRFINEQAALGTTTYRNTVTYNQGPIKNNVLGIPDARGRIAAGSIFINRSYSGFYRRWIGSTTNFPSNPNNVRTLSLSTSLDTNNVMASQASPIFISERIILITIPDNRVLASVVTEANETLTTQFSLSNVFVQDAGGTDRAYKLYYLQTALPLNAKLTEVTIANV